MEMTVKKQEIITSEPAVIHAADQPIECDVLLPDYYPDISRVLCCTATGVVTDISPRGDRLIVDGVANVSLNYACEKGMLHNAEYKVPFTRQVQIKEGYSPSGLEVNTECPHISCRAISKRRLDISGTVSISIRFCDTKMMEVVCEAEGDGVQILPTEGTATKLIDQITRQIQLREEMELPTGMSPTGKVLRVTSYPTTDECRLVAGRVVVKGKLNVSVLYQTEDSEKPSLITGSLPIGAFLDTSAASNDAVCTAKLTTLTCEGMSDGEYDPTEGGITITATLICDVKLYENYNYCGATDGYSTIMNSELDTAQVTTSTLLGIPNFSFQHKESLPADEVERNIIDVTVTPTHPTAMLEDGILFASCKMNYKTLSHSEENGMFCTDHSADIKVSLGSFECDGNFDFLPRFEVNTINFGTDMGRPTVTVDYKVTGTAMCFKKHNLITDLHLADKEPSPENEGIGMRIYYAKPGEQVWDIAKKYGTVGSLIVSENALGSETLERPMPLIIPSV